MSRAGTGILLFSLAGLAAAQPVVVRIGDAPSAHNGGGSALLGDGRVVYFCGSPGAVTTDLFDPFLGRWTDAGATVDSHAAVSATTLPNGEVISTDFGFEPCILFSPDAGTWRDCAASQNLRDSYQLITVPDGTGLQIGGNGPVSGETAEVDAFDPTTGLWTPQPPMAQPRRDMSAALLNDGTVLIAGGPVAQQHTERRLTDGGWIDAGTLTDAVSMPCLVRLWDGRVLIGDPARSALYDPASSTWRDLNGTGAIADCCAAALLPDGRVATMFGAPAAVWLFDPVAETWDAGPAFVGASTAGFSALLPTGRWAVVSSGVVNLVDPASEHWVSAPAPAVLEDGATLTLLADGDALLAGGPSGLAFRFTSGSGWRATGPLRLPRSGHRATLLADGRVLVTGGGVARPELYDPVTGLWALLSPAAFTSGAHTATPLLDGRVLIVSGDSAQLFDPATLSFGGAIALRALHTGHTATRLRDGRVLIAGGAAVSAELFDPATDAFTATGDLVASMADGAAVLMPGGEVLALGGTAAQLWSPETGQWTAAGTLAGARAQHAALLLRNGKVLLAGGAPPADAELFDPLSGTGTLLPAGVAPAANTQLARLGDGRVLLVASSGVRILDEGRSGSVQTPALAAVAIDGGVLTATGAGWMSAPQGADGQRASASSNVPVLFFERPDTQEVRSAAFASWTDQGGIARVVPELGVTGVFVVVTGVPSVQQRYFVGPTDAGCASALACSTRRCEANVCCQACIDGTCRTDGCPADLPDAGSDAGIDAGTDAGIDGGDDAGFDAGAVDAGPTDAGPPDAGPPVDAIVRCGCDGAGMAGPIVAALLLTLLSRRRRRREH